MRRDHFLVLFFAISVLLTARVEAQPVFVTFAYFDDQSGEPEPPIVDEFGQPTLDGTPVCVIQDSGEPGPDSFDSVIGCFGSNGEELGLGRGYFLQEPAFVVSTGMSLYVKITAGERCWFTICYAVFPGGEEILISAGDWTVLNAPCEMPARVVLDYYWGGMPPFDPPLVCPCEDGVATDFLFYCVYHDWNENGVDQEDTVLICLGLNGDDGIVTPSIDFSDASNGEQIYVQVHSGACCWTTVAYTVGIGFQQIHIAWEDWACVNDPCGAIGPPPNPPTNVQASDDTLCMAVLVSWEHDGQDVFVFNIYRDNLLFASVSEDFRSALVPVASAAQHEFAVGATNQAGESRSNGELGSSFRLKFANGPEGDISGERLAGSEFTIQFDLPVATPEECRTVAALVLLSNGVSQGVLCFDSLVTEMTCQFPDTLTEALTNCRIALLTFDMDNEFGHDNTDTTESTFTLVPLAAAETPALPGEFSITTIYPNPFNSFTQIEFALPRAGAVSVDIYDILGQHIATLANGTYAAGKHTLVWDARDVSSGVYLCRASSGGSTLTRKLLLLR